MLAAPTGAVALATAPGGELQAARFAPSVWGVQWHPEVDDEVEAGEDFGAVESVKAASDLISPVSGTVVEVNEALEDKPELLNEDAFANWIMKVELSDKTELDNLMDAAAYEELCKE